MNAHDEAVSICEAEATGLNLRDPDDRMTFRARIADRTKNTKVTAIAEMAHALGERCPRNRRAAAVRALARGWGG